MAKTKKAKATLEEMIKLFDSIWEKDPMGAGLKMLTDWPGICEKNGWTSEEFDQLLHAKATELVMSQAQNIRVID